MNYSWLNEKSRLFLSRGYIEGPAEKRIEEIAQAAQDLIPYYDPNYREYKDLFLEYMSKGYYSLSTPVWVNFGKNKGLPISCYGSYVEDTLDSILETAHEIGMMSGYGGGTSAYLGDIRPKGSPISKGGKADGPTHYAKLYETTINVCRQGESRRGACAVWLPVEHPDIMDFLNIGTDGNSIQHLQYGVTVTDNWLQEMIDGDSSKRKVWAKIIDNRSSIGFPYIMFKDNSNKNTFYEETHYDIKASNLCSEIQLPSTENLSFVCCLGSINLLHWDEIKETNAVEVYTWFLNCVMKEFVQKAKYKPGLERAYNFAKNHRAIGLGVLGWHSYLQHKLIPFESMEANLLNTSIFKTIRERADQMSQNLSSLILSIRNNYANTTVIAIAPTKSSSYILGQVSMGIEPIKSNYFVKDIAKVKEIYKNPMLEKELEKYNLNTPEIWKSILEKDGSVQHLDFPTKEVFKTFAEISPTSIIIQAASRQKYIDQSQSLNLFISPDAPVKDINQLYLKAWKLGVKTLYYQFSKSAAQNYVQNILECKSCES